MLLHASNEQSHDVRRLVACVRAMAEHALAIHVIKRGLAPGATDDDLYQAAVAWFELPNAARRALWIAPSKGGPWTTAERRTIKSTEFRRLVYGEE